MLGNILVLAAATPTPSPTGKASGSSFNPTFLILIVLVVGVFYMMTRSNRRRQQQAQQKMNAVEPGVRVRTTAGMYATVVSVDGDDVVLEVAPGVQVKYMKRAIMDVVPEEEPVTGFAPGEGPVTDFASDEPETEETGDVTEAESVKKD